MDFKTNIPMILYIASQFLIYYFLKNRVIKDRQKYDDACKNKKTVKIIYGSFLTYLGWALAGLGIMIVVIAVVSNYKPKTLAGLIIDLSLYFVCFVLSPLMAILIGKGVIDYILIDKDEEFFTVCHIFKKYKIKYSQITLFKHKRSGDVEIFTSSECKKITLSPFMFGEKYFIDMLEKHNLVDTQST